MSKSKKKDEHPRNRASNGRPRGNVCELAARNRQLQSVQSTSRRLDCPGDFRIHRSGMDNIRFAEHHARVVQLRDSFSLVLSETKK